VFGSSVVRTPLFVVPRPACWKEGGSGNVSGSIPTLTTKTPSSEVTLPSGTFFFLLCLSSPTLQLVPLLVLTMLAFHGYSFLRAATISPAVACFRFLSPCKFWFTPDSRFRFYHGLVRFIFNASMPQITALRSSNHDSIFHIVSSYHVSHV
jgi:hypothetical protein